MKKGFIFLIGPPLLLLAVGCSFIRNSRTKDNLRCACPLGAVAGGGDRGKVNSDLCGNVRPVHEQTYT